MKRSVIEKIFAEHLEKNGIEYVREYTLLDNSTYEIKNRSNLPTTIRYHYRYDFYIPSEKLLIELDDENHDRSESLKKADARKEELAKEYGFNFKRVNVRPEAYLLKCIRTRNNIRRSKDGVTKKNRIIKPRKYNGIDGCSDWFKEYYYEHKDELEDR